MYIQKDKQMELHLLLLECQIEWHICYLDVKQYNSITHRIRLTSLFHVLTWTTTSTISPIKNWNIVNIQNIRSKLSSPFSSSTSNVHWNCIKWNNEFYSTLQLETWQVTTNRILHTISCSIHFYLYVPFWCVCVCVVTVILLVL